MKTLTVLVQPIHQFVSVVLELNPQNIICYIALDSKKQRHKLLDKLADFYESTSSNKRLHLSEELLLAPKTDLVTRKHNFWIKDALFEFIADTHVKL